MFFANLHEQLGSEGSASSTSVRVQVSHHCCLKENPSEGSSPVGWDASFYPPIQGQEQPPASGKKNRYGSLLHEFI